MKKYSKEQLLKNFTLIFLFFFPISGLKIFHNHITNLIVVLIIGLNLLLTLIIIKKSRKNFKYLIIYYFVCLIYLIISYIRSKNFVSLIPNEYNLFNEALTIIKLVMPVTFLYSLYYQNITKKEYFIIIKSWIIFIAGSIIISNIFKISLSSYAEQHITKNIFEWGKDIYYVYTASKGYFMYANQVAVILLMLLITAIYDFFIGNKKEIVYLFITSVAMIMLGTRVSTMGGLLTLIFIYISYLIISIIKKEKISNHSHLILVVILMWILLIPISPYANRNVELTTSNIQSESANIIDKVESIETNTKFEDPKIQFVYDNYNPDRLPKFFFENYYPINYDTEFWYNLLSSARAESINYRFLEENILKRMWEIDSKKSNIFFGMSNSRIQNVVNLERDLELHYFAYGIIGSIILLSVYIYLVLKSGLMFLHKKDFSSFIVLSSIAIFLLTSFLTGNILNSIFTIVAFSFVISIKNVT